LTCLYDRKNFLIGRFYREWTQVGTITEREQIGVLKVLTDQITRANVEGKNAIMLGDANLDSEKWNDRYYRHYNVAREMQNALKRNGMKNIPLGNTFLADKTRLDGAVTENALDHVYIQKEMVGVVKITKGKLSATDHLPIMAEVTFTKTEYTEKQTKPRKIYKRSMKDSTENNWKQSLAVQDWEKLGGTEDIEDMAEFMDQNITRALNDCAPFKTITIRQS
jgi:hypothetical protein